MEYREVSLETEATTSTDSIEINSINTYDRHFPDKDPSPTLLIIDDEESSRRRLKAILQTTEEGRVLKSYFCGSLVEALEVLANTSVHVILLDKRLGADPTAPGQNGIEAIPEILQIQPHVQIIMVTGSNDHKDTVRAMSLGAVDYVTKETPDSLLLSRIHRAIALSKISINQARQDRTKSYESTELGGKSRTFKAILAQTQILSESNRPVLLLGESGTGKTEIAKWINECRRRFLKQGERPFFHINMAALSSDVVESELFGHEKGSFTDATETRQGFFELSNNGTLFLDEIGEASLDLQAKLLTVIESGEFYRLGSKKKLKSSPKIICATNRNLEEMVQKGLFREDLLMRISSFPIRMPNLDERREDVPDIIRALLPKCCKYNNVFVKFEDIPGDFIDHLMRIPLKGNIRGIEHQLDRLLVFSQRDANGKPNLKNWRGIPGLYVKKNDPFSQIAPEKTSISLKDLQSLPFDVVGSGFPGLKNFLGLITKKILEDAIHKHGRITEVAQVLHLAPGHVSTLLKQNGVVRSRAPRSSKVLSFQHSDEESL